MKTNKVVATLLIAIALMAGTLTANAHCGRHGCWRRPCPRVYVAPRVAYYEPVVPYYPPAPVYIAPRVVVRPAPVVYYRPAPHYYRRGGWRRY